MLRLSSLKYGKVMDGFVTPIARVIDSTRGRTIRLSSTQPLHDDEFIDFEWSQQQTLPRFSNTANDVAYNQLPITSPTPRFYADIYEHQHTSEAISAGKLDNISNKQTPSVTISPHSLIYYSNEKPIPITSKLQIIKPGDEVPHGVWPVFRLMVRFHLNVVKYVPFQVS
jgi:hypothetical protein